MRTSPYRCSRAMMRDSPRGDPFRDVIQGRMMLTLTGSTPLGTPSEKDHVVTDGVDPRGYPFGEG